MTATMTMEDVEHLAAALDAPFGDLDERDQELLQAIFALAGEAANARNEADEVSGFSFSWGVLLPAVQTQNSGSPLSNSFLIGLNKGPTDSGPLGSISHGELNPQPLPP